MKISIARSYHAVEVNYVFETNVQFLTICSQFCWNIELSPLGDFFRISKTMKLLDYRQTLRMLFGVPKKYFVDEIMDWLGLQWKKTTISYFSLSICRWFKTFFQLITPSTAWIWLKIIIPRFSIKCLCIRSL